jgi:hypothetical protein
MPQKKFNSPEIMLDCGAMLGAVVSLAIFYFAWDFESIAIGIAAVIAMGVALGIVIRQRPE